MDQAQVYDVVVVGGGPAGATAAADLARKGRRVLLLDRAGRIKPCGGAIPPRLMREFEIPESLLVERVTAARMVAPSRKHVDIRIEGGYVGMVNREAFDEWLRERAAGYGAQRMVGTFDHLSRAADGTCTVHYQPGARTGTGTMLSVQTRAVIGADGAKSAVARQCVPGAERMRYVFAYHEIIRAPLASDARARVPAGPATPSASGTDYDRQRCDVVYEGALSPDFYSWVFPHGDTVSVGTGSADKGFSLRGSVANLRRTLKLEDNETLRREGAPIPLKPLKRWDNGRDVVLAGDAAGVVAPASGEGIYYAMLGGRLAADAAEALLLTGDVRKLRSARQRFMKSHGRVFWVLGIMQTFWYSSDRRRERFVSICEDRDVQKLTFDAYMNKELVRAKPMAHVRIFFKDLAHLVGLVAP